MIKTPTDLLSSVFFCKNSYHDNAIYDEVITLIKLYKKKSSKKFLNQA